MANTEHIEAKLCAFVDGELDAAGRAEIEAHLQANPQHRQLLAELMEQRQFLRDLPRERAPIDLNESLQTQLERSVLFDDKTETPYVAGRINRWPPIVLAAVLLLSVGLLTIIYFILPEQRNAHYATIATTAPLVTESDGVALPESAESPSTVALATPSPDARAEREGAERSSSAAPDSSPPGALAPGESLALSDTIRSQHIPEADMLRHRHFDKAGPTTQPAGSTGDIFAKGVADGYASNMGTSANFFNQPLDALTNSRLQNSSAVRDNSALLVVAAANPAACNRDVTAYLTQNSIHWEPLTEPMPQPIQLKKDDFVASKMPRNADRERLSKGGAEFKEKAFDEQVERDSKQLGQQQAAAPSPPPAPAPEPPPTDASSGVPAAPGASPVQQRAEQTPAPSLPTAQVPAVEQQQWRGGGGSDQPMQQAQQGEQMPPAEGGAQIIVARNLTRQQVAELFVCASAHAGNETQIAQYNRSSGVVPPSTLYADIRLRRALQGELRLDPTTQSTAANQQQVTTTQPVKLEGEGSEIDAAKVAATAPTVAINAAPSTQSFELGVPPPPAEPPASQPLTPLPIPPELAEKRLTAAATAPAVPATTQPVTVAGIATQPTEEPIDVVIVLQPPSPPAAAINPPPTTTSPTP